MSEFYNGIQRTIREYEMSEVQKNNLNEMSVELHNENVQAGWWTKEEKEQVENGTKYGVMVVATKLALVHSEVSEALEGVRKNLMDDHLPHRKMIEVELADVVIRLLDLAGALNLDIGGAVAEKNEYNKKRQDHKKSNREADGGKMI
jgi:NTP pyrophosphatase (non-canonical NTP hydrolase)